MRRADRLFQIVQALRGGRLTTAQVLAEQLEVSPRTIYRDIADLIGTGVPIEGEAGVGYVMRAGYDMPPLMFTEDEVVALVAGARLIRAWGGAAMAAAAEEALIKIEAVLPETARTRAQGVRIQAIVPGGIDPELRARIDAFESHSQDRIRLHLSYRDVNDVLTDRVVRPLGLIFWGKAWTLVAWCEKRADFRAFRVDRIETYSKLDRFRAERDKSLAAFYEIHKEYRQHMLASTDPPL